MTSLGKNVRITIDREHRGRLRAVMEGVLRCEVSTPMPDMDLYRLTDGSLLGAYLAASDQALPATELDKAPWLELVVDDPAAARKALAGLGIEPFDYHDKTHDYYQVPGMVFRLASR